jgi:3',5'-cyclic AMP phosphodiesterase CpdA
MKLILLHLSDLHIKESVKKNPILLRAESLVAAAASTAPNAAHCFVVITGDIAFSGQQIEYSIADSFFKELQDHLSNRLSGCDCHFVMIPGNHDCDFSKPNPVREALVAKLTPDNFDEAIYSKCVEVQDNYRAFANQWRAQNARVKKISGIYTREIYDLPETVIEFHLINSAWMSSLEECQGRHLFPVELLESGNNSGYAASLVVTALHHPYNWFEAVNARALRSQLEATSDIILTGHEHEGGHFYKRHDTGERIEYLEGVLLQDSKNPYMSQFHVVVIDLNEQMHEVHTFAWDKKSGPYRPESASIPSPFQRNRHRLQMEFVLKESFEEFLTDPGAQFTHPTKQHILLNDLFVYPDLLELGLPSEGAWSKALVRDKLPTFVLDKRRLLLVGAEKCGKTTLAKILFQDLRRSGYIPIYISGSEFKDCKESSVHSVVERHFEEAYSSPEAYIFQQTERSKKAILIDDFHMSSFNLRGRDKIITILEGLFDVIVLFGAEQLRFDDLVTQEGEDLGLWRFTHCQILPFGPLHRSDLIEKWCFLGRRLTHDEHDLLKRAVQAEKTVSLLMGKNFIPTYPIFILMLLQQMEATTRLETAPNSGSYGFLYESLLTTALAQSSGLDEDLGTQYTYLSEFAYYLFTRQEHSIGMSEALGWHESHCKKYSLRLNFEKLLSNFCQASVLCVRDNTVTFRYKYMYYYFVARYFSQNIDEDAIRSLVSVMSKRLYHTESANIILFLSYLSKDPFILSSILEASNNLFSSYPEYDLLEQPELFHDLSTELPQLILDSSHPRERRRRLLARGDEIEAVEFEPEEDSAPHDVSAGLDDQLDDFMRINVAFKTIQILGQILRNRPGDLRGDQKLELTRECYSLGLRVLSFMFGAAEMMREDLIQFFVELLREKNPTWSDRQITGEISGFLFNLLEGLTFVIVKQVSDSVGLEKLSITFDDLLEQANNTSYRFVDASVKLDYYRDFPRREVLQLYKDIRRNPFSTHLLRHIVWFYFYIHETRHDLRQSICDKLDIKLLPAQIYDRRLKRPKP